MAKTEELDVCDVVELVEDILRESSGVTIAEIAEQLTGDAFEYEGDGFFTRTIK